MTESNSLGARWLLAAICLLLPLPSDTSQASPEAAQENLTQGMQSGDAGKAAALPRTPPAAEPLANRLAAAGIALGAPLLIRIFKKESELEVWAQKNGTYILFATYPICNWSGTLGPKLREGDLQTPEGFYSIGARQLHFGSRWPRSLDLGYPNIYDRVNGRTGSVILVHGGCKSKGCLAMTDGASAELYELVSTALTKTDNVPVHVFPFRMNEANLAAHANETWREFWADLKSGYDSFERTRRPPRITVCTNRYRAEDAAPSSPAAQTVSLCEEDLIDLRLRIAAGDESAAMVLSETLPGTRQKRADRSPALNVKCNRSRPSCKKWIALRSKNAAAGLSRAAP